jgi:hypothetical protein
MRKFIDLIVEASLPGTDYGYWISQFAEVYPVGDHGHERFIRSVEGCNSAEAMKSGWVRVIVGHNVLQAEACFPVLKPRVKAKLIQLARAVDYSSFIVDNHNGTGDYTVNQYNLLHDFIHGVEELSRREPALTENDT